MLQAERLKSIGEVREVVPFGRRVSLSGLAIDTEPGYFESERDELFVRLGAEGQLGGWTWLTEFSSSRSETDTMRLNVRDPGYFAGVNSDGVSEAVIARFSGIDQAACEVKRAELGGTRYTYSSFFGGNCSIWGAPPDPINPFGDLNPYIIAHVGAGSKNQRTQFEAVARGELFNMPGGSGAGSRIRLFANRAGFLLRAEQLLFPELRLVHRPLAI